ncbi:hypothetical protein FNU79_15975 [Deinococcus detaillensis]|uniref:Lipoprotein n=1 Tax=Deinococcus detaillensis TaxID=2592048 RepID=A0A553UKV5_9DEIO|nr:hypothetical protein [Deinococcus detaillensis]TSA80829.1 hypothetical protein FNU79_15975 [Deinococcus detaillensis]
MKQAGKKFGFQKVWLLWALVLPLAGCNGGISGVTPTGYQDAYRVSLTNLGYEVDTSGKITIPAVNANLTSTAGAPDVRELDYTAILLNGDGDPATADNSPIVPAKGTLMVGAKGGYRCVGTTPTPEAACTLTSSDAVWSNNGSWAANTAANKAITPGEWAIGHISAAKAGNTAQWYAEFTYTAYMTTGSSVSWKQRYQFTNPAKAGS